MQPIIVGPKVPIPDLRKSHPHLWRSLAFAAVGAAGNGSCFHRAVALCLDMPRVRIAIGTVRAATADERRSIPNASTVPFIHAWCELGKDTVYTPTLVERWDGLIPFDREQYYHFNGVSNVHHVSRKRVMDLAKLHSWSSHILRDKPRKLVPTLGQVILEASGIPHMVNEDRGVTPL
jgi:hypothetical protein